MLLMWKKCVNYPHIFRHTPLFKKTLVEKTNPLLKHAICTNCLWPSNLPPPTEWGYDFNGPETWSSKWSDAAGCKQSPVNIVSSAAKVVNFEKPLSWQYENCSSYFLDGGAGWRVDVDSGTSDVKGGPLPNVFELVQFHAHWGGTNDHGSEHTVDGKNYSGELHFVHWNKGRYASCSDALCAPLGLAVIGVFLEVGEENPGLQILCESIPKLSTRDQRISLHKFDISSLFPSRHSFWSYCGSLTTPPCYESVSWILLQEPVAVSAGQLDIFRSMRKASKEGGHVQHNCRPLQPINGRQIFQSR